MLNSVMEKTMPDMTDKEYYNETTIESCIYGEDCPLHAENPPFNAVTLAAIQEARDIADGKIPGKWYSSIEEAREDLGI
jgi:hypothetical protein